MLRADETILDFMLTAIDEHQFWVDFKVFGFHP